MVKNFLMKDLSGRGFSTSLGVRRMRQMFHDLKTVDDVLVTDAIDDLELGDTFDFDEVVGDHDFTATQVIRTK